MHRKKDGPDWQQNEVDGGRNGDLVGGYLSHSGSQGFGANIAQQYTKLAMSKCRLPHEARHLACLDLDTEEGPEYWLAMNLAGDYASACYHQIYHRLAKALGEPPLTMVENHYNFAWKETDATECAGMSGFMRVSKYFRLAACIFQYSLYGYACVF